MWTGTVAFAQLRQRGRWKVEFFCNEGTSRVATAYESVLLREIFEERRETIDPQAYSEHVFNYLGLEHVESVTGDLVDFQPRLGKKVLSRSKIFRMGDILYGRLRPNLNKVFLATEQVTEGICSGEFYVLMPDNRRILPHFARAVLASKYVQDYVVGLITGSALPRLQIEDLLAIEIPLPPVKTQRGFEEFLVKGAKRRRKLAQDLSGFTESMLESVVNALESGVEPTTITDWNSGKRPASFENPLPPGDFFSGRKGRKTGFRQGLLELS
jgi:hypothetical protein